MTFQIYHWYLFCDDVQSRKQIFTVDPRSGHLEREKMRTVFLWKMGSKQTWLNFFNMNFLSLSVKTGGFCQHILTLFKYLSIFLCFKMPLPKKNEADA